MWIDPCNQAYLIYMYHNTYMIINGKQPRALFSLWNRTISILIALISQGSRKLFSSLYWRFLYNRPWIFQFKITYIARYVKNVLYSLKWLKSYDAKNHCMSVLCFLHSNVIIGNLESQVNNILLLVKLYNLNVMFVPNESFFTISMLSTIKELQTLFWKSKKLHLC